MTARLSLALLVLCACAGGPERPASIPQLSLADTALVSIPDAVDGEYAMPTVSGATRLHDGGFAVWAGPEVFAFDATGRFLRRYGGRGTGPGEFSFIYGAAECAPDTLGLWDGSQRRVTSLALADGSVQIQSVHEVPQRSLFAGCAGDSIVVAASNFDYSYSMVQDTILILAIAPATGGVDTLAKTRDVVHVGPLQRFSPFTSTAARGGTIVLGDNGTAQLVRWSASGRDTIVAHLARLPATEHLADSVKDWWALHSGPKDSPQNPEIRRMIDEAWAKLPAPDTLPLFSKILLDDHGTIWLSDYVGYPTSEFVHPTRWTSINDRGKAAGTLPLPPGFVLSEISGGAALGVLENEDGSRVVQVRELEGGQDGQDGRDGRVEK
jgi:hypothetical protein